MAVTDHGGTRRALRETAGADAERGRQPRLYVARRLTATARVRIQRHNVEYLNLCVLGAHGEEKNYRPLIALAALAVAALALATLTFTNVTYWLINAILPPAMKYAGTDATSSATSQYVKVSYYYDPDTGYNVTRISIIGFTGDPTEYTDVLRLCNKYYSGTLYAKLVAVGTVDSTGYESYVREFRVYFVNPTTTPNYVEFQGTSVTESATGWVAIPNGECATVGAYVLVDPTLPEGARDGQTVLATYQVNVVFSTSNS